MLFTDCKVWRLRLLQSVAYQNTKSPERQIFAYAFNFWQRRHLDWSEEERLKNKASWILWKSCSPALTVKYNLCKQLLYELSCPSTKKNDPEYFCGYCRKRYTTKALLKLHLKATQHHSYNVVSKDESETENVDELEDAPVIHDGPCLIRCVKVFLMDTFETTYERRNLL